MRPSSGTPNTRAAHRMPIPSGTTSAAWWIALRRAESCCAAITISGLRVMTWRAALAVGGEVRQRTAVSQTHVA